MYVKNQYYIVLERLKDPRYFLSFGRTETSWKVYSSYSSFSKN